MHIAKKYDRWFSGDADLCSIDISLQNARCDGDYFTAMVFWALERFKAVEIVLFDTLYRHNYQGIGHPTQGIQAPANAERLAQYEGDLWIQRNRETLEQVQKKGVELIRWDHWRFQTELSSHIELMEDFLNQSELMELVEKDAVSFLEAKKIKTHVENYSQVKKHLMDFIIEEMAVFYMQKKNNRIVHLYPGKTLGVRIWLARNKCVIQHDIADAFSQLNVIRVVFRDFNKLYNHQFPSC